MLKSTHRPAQTAAALSSTLPPGWSEHKAPSGHTYYYNSETKKSTYTRPAAEAVNHHSPPPPPVQPAPIHYDPRAPPVFTPFSSFNGAGSFPNHSTQSFPGRGNFRGRGASDFSRRPRQHPDDRPKSKHAIPGCDPWLLIKTRLGRRFVHNPESKESFWKVPQHLIGGLVEFDIQERERREEPNKHTTVPLGASPEAAVSSHDDAVEDNTPNVHDAQRFSDNEAHEDVEAGSGSEYEEVEVTDDEMDEEQQSPKRQKTDQGEEQPSDQPVELGEDDMAFQLAQMGASYDLDPGEYGDGDYNEDWEEGAEGIPLTEEEASASFKDILDDYRVNPYTTWDSVLTDNRVVEDHRYTLLPNMKTRREVFAEWSTARIQSLKQLKEQQVKRNPRIPYLAFLEQNATPKLYWPEFRRKHKQQPELRESGLGDKEREKIYREHITRITKIPEATLKSDLQALLRLIPPSDQWNRSTSLDGVFPPELLTDVRYISLKKTLRDQAMKDFIATLPPSEDVRLGTSSQDDSNKSKDRERREAALKERERQVEDAKRQQEKRLRYEQRRLKDEEAELDKAMRVGKGGLRGNLEDGIPETPQSTDS